MSSKERRKKNSETDRNRNKIKNKTGNLAVFYL